MLGAVGDVDLVLFVVEAGSFTLAEAQPPLDAPLLDPRVTLRDYGAIVVDDHGAGLVAHGRSLPDVDGPTSGPWAVLDPAGDLLAVYEADGHGGARPVVVLTSE